LSLETLMSRVLPSFLADCGLALFFASQAYLRICFCLQFPFASEGFRCAGQLKWRPFQSIFRPMGMLTRVFSKMRDLNHQGFVHHFPGRQNSSPRQSTPNLVIFLLFHRSSKPFPSFQMRPINACNNRQRSHVTMRQLGLSSDSSLKTLAIIATRMLCVAEADLSLLPYFHG
jgi:hypothetical protein